MGSLKSIKTIFAVIMVIMTVIVFSLQTGFNLYHFTKVLEEKVFALLDAQARNEATRLNSEFVVIGKTVESLAKAMESMKGYDTAIILDIVKRYMSDEPLVYGGGFWLEPYGYSPDMKYYGPYVYRSREDSEYHVTWDYSSEQYDYFKYDWYKNGLTPGAGVVWSEPYLDNVSGVAMITVTSPIRKDGRTVGVTTFDVDIASLIHYVANMKVGNNGYALLVSSKGRDVGSLIAANYSKVGNNEADLNQLRNIAGAEIKEGQCRMIRTTMNNQEVIAGVAPVGETGLRLVMVMPAEEAFAPLGRILTSSIIVLFGAIVLLVVMLLRLFERKVALPLQKLKSEAVRIGGGDLEHMIMPEIDDEIGQLAAEFDQMRKKVFDLMHKLQDKNEQLMAAYEVTIRAFYTALESREINTAEHSLQVNVISMEIGKKMALSEEQLRHLNWGTLLHDIGKLGITDSILLKPGPLTDEETSLIKEHPEVGYKILQGSPFLQQTAEIALYHQEKFNGKGYPYGLKGEDIPILARICSVADAFQVMIADRPYRKGMSVKAAIDEIIRCSGTHFDPDIVEILLSIDYSQFSGDFYTGLVGQEHGVS